MYKKHFSHSFSRILVPALVLSGCVLLTGCGKTKSLDLKNMDTGDYIQELVDYKNLSVTVTPRNEVDQDTVEYYIQDVLQNRGELITEGTVANGDTVNIDYAGTIDGEAFDGGTAQGQYLTIGSGQFIDGFEEGLIGVSVGETVDLDLVFPENYYEELAGKAVVFTVTVNGILPQLTDEVACELDEGVNSAAEYRELVENFLNEYSDYIYEADLQDAMADALIAGTVFKDLPDELVDRFEAPLRETYEAEAKEAGMELKEYMSTYYNITDTDTIFRNAALSCTKEGLVLQAIANLEGLNVEDADLDESIDAFVETAEEFENAEDFLEVQDRELTRENIMYQKVYDYLSEIITVSEE
ncbi:MAG: trigger factor [Lachnospiraceae bacterium]|nr:trigger factor [Lachnospiraceae bacterium]